MTAVEDHAPDGARTATAVGLRELKQRLSEFVHRAESGETILITERGVPIVTMSAVPGSARLRQGIEEGWITPPKNGWGGLRRREPLEPLEEIEGSPTSQELLDEDRGE